MESLKTQVGGSHYKKFIIQPVEYVQRNKYNFCCGNIVKYVLRYKDKNGLEDLRKVTHYCDLEKELLSNSFASLVSRNLNRAFGNYISVNRFTATNVITNVEVRKILNLVQSYHLTGDIECLDGVKTWVGVLSLQEYGVVI